jgi:RNA polymerase sigma-70 factor, ECF subfamily
MRTAQPIADGPTSMTGPAMPATRSDRLDPESRHWLERLGPGHPERAAAIEELHALLLGAARFEIGRRRATVPHLRGGDHDDLAHQAADDALVAILAKLGDFRGDSRFTTWAYKFALLEAAVKVRRRAWQGREVPLAPERWEALARGGATTPQQSAETAELLAAVRRAIGEDLTVHQRTVLVAVVLEGVPIDVLADRLGSTRGALYKTIHDARRRLRAVLAAGGHEEAADR